jgi:hypothetical protein
MSAVRKEMKSYIDNIPDSRLKALKPLLVSLSNEEDELIIETDLTDEEKAIIKAGRAEFAKGNYVTMEL